MKTDSNNKEVQFKICSLFESDLSDEVLKYIDKLGKPDRIIYYTDRGHYYAKLTYVGKVKKNDKSDLC